MNATFKNALQPVSCTRRSALGERRN